MTYKQPSLFEKYPNTPGSKSRKDTSIEAAKSIRSRAEILRDRVLSILKERSLTADEVASILEESILSIRPRVSELYAKGLIMDTGLRRKNLSGKFAVVWRANIY